MALGYDANGNLRQKGTQLFGFDIGNRNWGVIGQAGYAYDGHGRRYWALLSNGTQRNYAYSQAGKLLMTWDSARGTTAHVYLDDKLLAEVNGISGVRYTHTDALGSPVVMSDSSGAEVERLTYEAYGGTASGLSPTGIGFTGHVNDAETGLVQMQQRYYDAVAGRFLSVDPVTTNAANGDDFNHYRYADNNPYVYVDPDGRNSVCTGSHLKTDACSKGEAVPGLKIYQYAAQAADSTIIGGYGLRFSAAVRQGSFWQAALELGAGTAYGTINVATWGNAGLVISGLRGLAAKEAISLWPAASGGRTVINGLEYTTHALQRMQPVGTIIKDGAMFSRGVPPSAVENAVKLGKVTPGNSASEVVRTFENVRVITNREGTRVISVIKIGN